ncbi:MAG: hypothetical protein J0H97_19210 [Alphaproteobacteria bacterium]|nr:hypothetical protein [Alphaproteobacteria bacterium]
MTAGPTRTDSQRKWRAIAAAVILGAVFAVGLLWPLYEDAPTAAPTVGEKLIALRTERAALQARADGVARVELLQALRVASQLSDALIARDEAHRERAFDRLPERRRRAFAELDALNAALRDALERPGEGARLAVGQVATQAMGEVDRFAAAGDGPVVLSYTPRFVPPRHVAAELSLAPGQTVPPAADGALRLDQRRTRAEGAAQPAVPRYVPPFAAPSGDDPPVEIEIVGLHLAAGRGAPPVLTIGTWRGEATVTPERLRFSVPRSVFPTEATRTRFTTGSLALRHASRSVTFQLLFTVLPDRPGSFAFDQRIRTTEPETNTQVSPEILARAPAGETRTVRRCFDPPQGWRFDMEKRRVVIVERLGWVDDVPDETMNGGSVEFVASDTPEQICLAVIARPVNKEARTATIGRFETTLVREKPVERVIQSGVRALDWNEPARVPIEPGMAEWKLYIRLFDEIDREFGGKADAGAPPSGIAFLRIAIDDDGRMLVLGADPEAGL